MSQLHIISHMSTNLNEDECTLFERIMAKKGDEYTAWLWYEWYFQYKNDKNNTIRPDFHERMIKAINSNIKRIHRVINQK